jgi:polysaccharide biosynthesis protein PslG
LLAILNSSGEGLLVSAMIQIMYRTILTCILLPVLIASAAPPTLAAPINQIKAPPPVNGPAFGINSHLATRYPDPSSMAIPATAVADLGVRWVREDLHWHRVQPRPDVWDWTFTDAALRELLSRNINVLGVLGPSVGWATPHRGDTPNDVSYYPPDNERFLEYVRGVVTRYRRYVKYWEIWNEPDHDYFWQPKSDAAAYTRLLIRTAATIRSIDPEAKILIGGINPFDTTFLRTVAEGGAWNSFDILAIHPYVNPYEPESGNLIAAADAVRTLAAQHGEKPIWVTEIGWASGPSDRDARGLANEEQQASYLVRAMLMLWQAGVEQFFWYSLKDDPGNPYGLIGLGSGRTDYNPRKPAYYALQTLNQQLAGTTFVERRDLFERQVLVDFESVERWRRVSQPNGVLQASGEQIQSGAASAKISYSFTTRQNDYLAFERNEPLPLPGEPHALGIWVYGDNSTHGVKVWLRDSEGELLQFVLGSVGPPGWHFISTPIGGPVEAGNRLANVRNAQLDFPVSLVAIVVDDITDGFTGAGTIYLDNLTVIGGHETYDLRLQRGDESLDILWSPPGARLRLNTLAPQGTLVDMLGRSTTLPNEEGQLRINLGPAPVYVWHRR